MIDIKAVRANPEAARAGLTKKRHDPDLIDQLLAADDSRRRGQTEADRLRSTQKQAGQAIAQAGPDQKQALLKEMTQVKQQLSQIEAELQRATGSVEALLLDIPNFPHESVPAGTSESDDEVVATVGEPTIPEPLRDHQELGLSLGLIDLERGARVSGSRFAFLRGDAVRLQMSLERLALDILTPHQFVPIIPPVLVREAAMYGTGFFPTDRAQIYATEADDLYLVGTSEVPLAAMHADEIVPADQLPLRYLGMSTCFRREAGTYGKDTKGIFRVHQFDKLEMFSFCHPDQSWQEHDFLLEREREICDALELTYRVVNIHSGDLGASAAKKYDIEAWLPSEGQYRELTSTSNTTDYQARRLKVRVRESDGVRPLHTVNGTAVAIGRALTFLLEQHQQSDGTVKIPKALVDCGAPEVLRSETK